MLPPRDKEFYDVFDEMAATLIQSSRQLVEIFDAACSLQMADSLESLLRTAQQPPFGRAEIGEFSDGVTRIVKYINHAAIAPQSPLTHSRLATRSFWRVFRNIILAGVFTFSGVAAFGILSYSLVKLIFRTT